jgi:glucose-6-phosphate-specific signal transduction histidine kinase
MKVTFECSELSDETESIYGLAIYRICEQGFLNALTHGAAENCVVRLSVEDSWVHLTIENDGAGVQGAGRSARGSAVIDAWVSSFDGTWTLRNLEIPGNTSAGTVRLEAKLKFDARLSNPMDDGVPENLSLNAIATGPSKPGFVSN